MKIAFKINITTATSYNITAIVISILGGILLSVHLSETLLTNTDPAQIKSKIIIQALDNVMDRFYGRRTTVVFIMEQSTLTANNGLKPIEVAGELIRMQCNRTSMTYVIENHITLKQMGLQRFYNIFLVDSYESFR